MNDLWWQLDHFLHQGGGILWLILSVAFLIFLISAERLLYLQWGYPQQRQLWLGVWQQYQTRPGWSGMRIREALLAESQLKLGRALWLLKSCVLASPLLGLTGTVYGMIQVFDGLSYVGTGNPRLLSAGIFQATIPTMAGMVTGILGMILRQHILRMTRTRQQAFAAGLEGVAEAGGSTA